MKTLARFLLTILPLSFLWGCVSSYQREWIPPETLEKIDSAIPFKQLKESPDSYKGKIVLLGGEVLQAKRFPDHTRLVILQLPLDDYDEPVTDRQKSEGRFIAKEFDFLDPAIVAAGTRVTIVGTVSGSQTEPLDEMEYTYPIITIEQLKIWPTSSPFPYPYYLYRFPPYWYRPYYWYPSYFGPYAWPYYY